MSKIKDKSLISITIPIFLELLLITIVGNIDTVMLGKFSADSVGAVGGMSQVLFIQNTILSFICLGTTILMAQYIGAKNEKSIKEVISVSITMNICIGLLLGAFYFFGWELILKGIKLPLELRTLGKNYFKLVGGLCIFQGLSLTSGAVLKSYGNTKPMLFVNIGVNILNVIGNGMFLFGWFGAPILGVTGVGISTVFSRFIGAIIAIIVMFKFCSFSLKDLRIFSVQKVKNILSIGIPTAGEHLTWSVAQVIILSMVNTMGPTIITARTYLALLSSFIMTMAIALGHGTAIQVGHLVGAKENESAYKKCLHSSTFSFAVSATLSVLASVFRYQIMGIFTNDVKVIEVAVKVFPWFLFIETGRTFNIVIINSLHAAGDIKFPMVMACIIMLGVAVPASWLLGVHYKFLLIGIWIGNGLDEWLRGLSMLWRWRSKRWMNKGFI